MASYQSFMTHISQGDIMTAYRGVLTDINYCKNLLGDLETGRTYTEKVFDWLQGNRNEISDELISSLRELKGEVETGIGVFTQLDFKLNCYKTLKNIYETRLEAIFYSPEGKSSRFGFLETLKSHFDDFKNVIDQPGPPNITPQPESPNTTPQPATTYSIFSCAKSLSNWYDPTTYEDRSVKYKKVNSLNTALNQTGILKIFQETHSTVRGMIEDIDIAAVNINSKPKDRAYGTETEIFPTLVTTEGIPPNTPQN